MSMFPSMGIVGFRLLGASFILIALIAVFLALKDTIRIVYLLLGMLIVIICYISLPYSFCNAICSCFFYVCAIIFIYRGLVNKHPFLLLIGGILVGINIFTRIPNVLGIGLVIIVVCYKWYVGEGKRLDYKQGGIFMFGVITGILLIFLLMFILGHFSVFIESMYQVLYIGTASGSSHTPFRLFMTQLNFYSSSTIHICCFFSLYFVTNKYFWNKKTILPWILISSLWWAVYIYRDQELPCDYTWALGTIGCIMMALRYRDQRGLIALLGLFMLFVEPLGSDYAIAHASLPAMVAVPVACSFVLNRKNIIYVFVACLIIFLKLVFQGIVFLDRGSLFEKKYVYRSCRNKIY